MPHLLIELVPKSRIWIKLYKKNSVAPLRVVIKRNMISRAKVYSSIGQSEPHCLPKCSVIHCVPKCTTLLATVYYTVCHKLIHCVTPCIPLLATVYSTVGHSDQDCVTVADVHSQGQVWTGRCCMREWPLASIAAMGQTLRLLS